MQVSDGGFTDTSDGFVNAQSTGWAIEAMHAALRDPHALVVDGHSPYTFLASLRQKNGSYHDYPADIGDVMGATTQASFALGGRTLGSAPAKNRVTRFAPSFKSGSVVPKPGARLASGTVWIEAGYADNVNGTGIDAKAIRVTVERAVEDRGGPHHLVAPHARAHRSSPTARTRIVILVRDWAGNSVRVERSFTVAVPASGSGSTGGGTHPGSGSSAGSGGSSGSSGSGGTTTHKTATPTPTATISPAGQPGHHAEPHAFGLPRLPEPFTGRRHGADRRLERPRRRAAAARRSP